MHLSLLSREKPLFSGEVQTIRLPGSMAPFQILKGHADLITTLERGTLTYVPKYGEVTSILIKEGVVKVENNKVTVLVEPAENQNQQEKK